MSGTYASYEDRDKRPQPIETLIREAVAACTAKHPSARLTTLLLNPCHVTLGTWQVIDGTTWMLSYLPIVGPREVRVGPVD